MIIYKDNNKQDTTANRAITEGSPRVSFPRDVFSLCRSLGITLALLCEGMALSNGSFVVCSVIVLLGVAWLEYLTCGTVPFHASFMHLFVAGPEMLFYAMAVF